VNPYIVEARKHQPKWIMFRNRWRRAITREDWTVARRHAGDFIIYCEKHNAWPDWWSEAERVIDDAELKTQLNKPDPHFG
jgi:hypothetical protein